MTEKTEPQKPDTPPDTPDTETEHTEVDFFLESLTAQVPPNMSELIKYKGEKMTEEERIKNEKEGLRLLRERRFKDVR